MTMETLFALVAISILVFLCVLLAKKFNISKSEAQFANMVADLAIYLFNKSDYKFDNREKVEIALKYVQEAMDIAVDAYGYDDVSGLKNYVFDKTIEVLHDNDIKPDSELLDLVRSVIDFLTE